MSCCRDRRCGGGAKKEKKVSLRKVGREEVFSCSAKTARRGWRSWVHEKLRILQQRGARLRSRSDVRSSGMAEGGRKNGELKVES